MHLGSILSVFSSSLSYFELPRAPQIDIKKIEMSIMKAHPINFNVNWGQKENKTAQRACGWTETMLQSIIYIPPKPSAASQCNILWLCVYNRSGVGGCLYALAYIKVQKDTFLHKGKQCLDVVYVLAESICAAFQALYCIVKTEVIVYPRRVWQSK